MLARSLIAALLVADFSSPALAGALTEEAIAFIDGQLFRARIMSNPKAALDYCREAEARAAKHDQDPYYDGAIAKCLAYAHAHLKEKGAACQQQTRALERLQSVPADHPRHAESIELIGAMQKDQSWFGC